MAFRPWKNRWRRIPDTLRQLILERIQNLTHYEPVIGIMGKSGAGKSSLCNELFPGGSLRRQ